MVMLHSEPTLSLGPAGFLSFSVGEDLMGGFQQNIHQPMHQDDHIWGFENILWSSILFYFYLGSVWLLMGFCDLFP